MHVLLSLAIAAEWDGIQVGGELRLDASAQRLDLVGTGDGPVYDVGISRGALMLGAEPSFSTEVLLTMDVRSTDTDVLLADDGSLVRVPPGFEVQLLDARIHKVSPRWAGAVGRMPGLTGLNDYNQTLWTQRTPYFYLPGERGAQTVMWREGLTPERVMAARLTFGDTRRLDLQGSLDDEGQPLAEARVQGLMFGSVFVTASGRYQATDLGDWTWHGAALYTGWRASAMVQVFGVNSTLGYAVRLTAPVRQLELGVEGTYWDAEYGVMGTVNWRHTDRISTGLWYETRVPEEDSLAITHDAGLQWKTWF